MFAVAQLTPKALGKARKRNVRLIFDSLLKNKDTIFFIPIPITGACFFGVADGVSIKKNKYQNIQCIVVFFCLFSNFCCCLQGRRHDAARHGQQGCPRRGLPPLRICRVCCRGHPGQGQGECQRPVPLPRAGGTRGGAKYVNCTS